MRLKTFDETRGWMLFLLTMLWLGNGFVGVVFGAHIMGSEPMDPNLIWVVILTNTAFHFFCISYLCLVQIEIPGAYAQPVMKEIK